MASVAQLVTSSNLVRVTTSLIFFAHIMTNLFSYAKPLVNASYSTAASLMLVLLIYCIVGTGRCSDSGINI